MDDDLGTYQTILKTIGEFEDNTIQIHTLITRLEDILNFISDSDEIWRDNFFQNWATLEMARAIALSAQRAFLNEHETQKVFESVAELKRLVHDKLGFFDQIRKTLCRVWDPLEIGQNPHLADEYDAYIPRIAELVAKNGRADEITDYLKAVEEAMGLRLPTDRRLATARALVELDRQGR